jgi:hypothetical protein
VVVSPYDRLLGTDIEARQKPMEYLGIVLLLLKIRLAMNRTLPFSSESLSRNTVV